jgi:F420-0:gamma-glutamyl ligase
MGIDSEVRKKSPEIRINGETFIRIPIKTHLITKDDSIVDSVVKYSKDVVKDGDILFVTEKIVAIMQGRAYPIKDVKPSSFATFLSKHVTKSPYGIGLGMPETMEMALRECGVARIVLAAFLSALTKPFGKSGVFYDVAGYKARSIDGPTKNTIPPYNEYVVLGPLFPDSVAKEISNALGGVKVAVVDINDIDGTILGVSDKSIDKNKLVRILKDNPLGQCCEQTPMGIIRKTS